mgnify:CR=1 FL=1
MKNAKKLEVNKNTTTWCRYNDPRDNWDEGDTLISQEKTSSWDHDEDSWICEMYEEKLVDWMVIMAMVELEEKGQVTIFPWLHKISF